MRKLVINILYDHIVDYPTPKNINYYWGFGSVAGIFLSIQIITGIFLVMHYTPQINLSFFSIEHITRDVNYGWLLRYLHSNGASLFFILVFMHIARNLYYGSYIFPRQNLWYSGILLFILMMPTAFMGYVLPWGQMSYWGATVITNFITAIPIIGKHIVIWLWGGFAINNATLARFFSLHFFLPFLIIGAIFLHLIILHYKGSNNPLGINLFLDKINFYPYFYIKDFYFLIYFIIIFFFLVFFTPNILGHSDNYIEANIMITPTHIVPEWYFLYFYAILRSVPDKLGGVICMGFSLVILFILPFLNISQQFKIRSLRFHPILEYFYWSNIFNICILGWLGANVVEIPFIMISIISTFYYFFFFLIINNYIRTIEINFILQLLILTKKLKIKITDIVLFPGINLLKTKLKNLVI